jgi:hypothetical protein
MDGRVLQRLGGRQATKPSSDYHNPCSAVNHVGSYRVLGMIALDSICHSGKPYRSNARVSIDPSTESQLSRQG